MPSSTQPYVVRPGDYLTAIAHARGAKSDEIWQHPANARLRGLRKSPELLAPGDVIYLPIVAPKWLPVAIGEKNTFVAHVPRVDVHVVLKNSNGQPLAGKSVTTSPPLGPSPLTTDGSGALTMSVPCDVKLVRATLTDPNLTFDIRIGYLDPHDVTTGAVSRLRQLGYVADESPLLARPRSYLEGLHPTDVPLRQGVAAYQASKQTTATGDLDAQVMQQLHDDYGC
jgi:hypothetical protein